MKTDDAFQLDGDTEPAVHRISFRSVPAGRYAVRVTLTRVDGPGGTVMSGVHVLKASGEEWAFQ
jgi:hypothetical protein